MDKIENLILDVIYNCGGITKKGISQLSGSDDLLKSLMGKKIIRKQPVEVEDKKIALYTITDIGERFYTENTGKKHFYRCSRAPKIIALSYFYISMLDSCSEWKNKDEWYFEGEDGCIPDATYIQNDVSYGIIIVKESDKNKNFDNLFKFSEKHDISQIKRMCK